MDTRVAAALAAMQADFDRRWGQTRSVWEQVQANMDQDLQQRLMARAQDCTRLEELRDELAQLRAEMRDPLHTPTHPRKKTTSWWQSWTRVWQQLWRQCKQTLIVDGDRLGACGSRFRPTWTRTCNKGSWLVRRIAPDWRSSGMSWHSSGQRCAKEQGTTMVRIGTEELGGGGTRSGVGGMLRSRAGTNKVMTIYITNITCCSH